MTTSQFQASSDMTTAIRLLLSAHHFASAHRLQEGRGGGGGGEMRQTERKLRGKLVEAGG